MSHFAVLVIGDDVEKALAPFHEFECTGEDNEFIQDIDITDKRRAEWQAETVTRYRDPDGALHDPYEDRFYREPTMEEEQKHGLGRGGRLMGTGGGENISWHSKDWGDGRGYRAKIHFVPEGWSEVELSHEAVSTFQQYLEDYCGMKAIPLGQKPDLSKEHKYGYVLLAASGEVDKVIDRTNPDSHWDWYSIGGRWAGWLKLKPGAKGIVAGRRKGNFSMDDGPVPAGYADQARKGDVDFEQMRNDEGVKARAFWKKTREITAGLSWETWDDAKLRFVTSRAKDGEPVIDYDAAREFYKGQPAIELLYAHDREKKTHHYIFDMDDDLTLEEEKYVQIRRNSATSLFAYLKDGQWQERGSMGWFASVSNGVDKGQWTTHFNQMLDALPDDVLLTVVDAHT